MVTAEQTWLSEAEEDARNLASLKESKAIVESVLANASLALALALAADCQRIIARLEGEIAALEESIAESQREVEHDRLAYRRETGRGC